ncbi:MAG: PaaI family thioesterase [Woeseiaceae bacterium]
MTGIVDQLNASAPPYIRTLGGKIDSFDKHSGVIEFHFMANESHTHSDDIIQGGFVAGMLDAAMAHVVFCTLDRVVILATLEMKVSYLDIARPGKLVARGWVLRMGKTIGFLEADLTAADGTVLAKASSTVRIIHRQPAIKIGSQSG